LLTANGAGLTTGGMPTAMLLSPTGETLFVANSATNNISTYTVKTDGTLTAGSSSATTGATPLSMAIDSASHFLFVANQGSQIDPASGTVIGVHHSKWESDASCRITISRGRGFGSERPGSISDCGDARRKFLYVANQFEATVSSFAVDGNLGRTHSRSDSSGWDRAIRYGNHSGRRVSLCSQFRIEQCFRGLPCATRL